MNKDCLKAWRKKTIGMKKKIYQVEIIKGCMKCEKYKNCHRSEAVITQQKNIMDYIIELN